MLNQIKSQADAVFPDVLQLRRTIHQNPELALEEHETAALVQDTLAPLDDVTVRTGVYETGIVATLQGGQPGPTLLLRADMDALPIQEETGLAFTSRNDGTMHACGHDAHTSSLLGTAKILHALRGQVHGNVRFLFQPSEERVPGGAKFMIEEGALDENAVSPSPEAVFAQHVDPRLPIGTIGICSGTYMASADEIHITVHGERGHAAEPHNLRTDAALVASHIVVALQSIVSRHQPPLNSGVLTIGKIATDGATNIIPGTAKLEGTLRAMDEEWRFRAHELIHRIAEHTAQAHGAEVDVDIKVGYPVVYNHEAPTELVRQAAQDYLGGDNIIELEPWFAGEDFAYFLRERPGSFYRLGTRNEEKGITHRLHTSQFTIDEEALRLGPGFMAYLTWKYGAEPSAASNHS